MENKTILHLKKQNLFEKVFNSILRNPYILLSPVLLISLIFVVYPLGFGIVTSFLKWDIFSNNKAFVGLKNYQFLFSNIEFKKAFINTLIYSIINVNVGVLLALIVGIFLNKNRVQYNFVQTIIFTPQVIPVVSIALIFSWLMDPSSGVFNYLLSFFGVEPLYYLRDSSQALFSVLFIVIWQGLGYGVLIIIAGLQNIPSYIYEAAKLDRSSNLKTFRKITIPLLSPTLVFIYITSTIGSFLAFDTIKILTNGGPDGATTTLAFYIYQVGFQFFRVSEAMAAAVILVLIITVMTLFNVWITRKMMSRGHKTKSGGVEIVKAAK